MSLILILSLAVCAGYAVRFAGRVLRARNLRRLLGEARGLLAGVPGDVGITVIYSGSGDAVQVENLLSEECDRYEVVVVVDAQRSAQTFELLVARYRMIRVEYVPCRELPMRGVRAVMRSRRRCYRRLVLIDRPWVSAATDFDTAAGVAAYDLLLPLCDGQYLLPGAILRLETELARFPARTVESLCTTVGEPLRLVARDVVLAGGGFSDSPLQRVPPERRKSLCEVLCVTAPRRKKWPNLPASCSLALAAAAVGSVAVGWWVLSALLLTATVVALALQYAARLLDTKFSVVAAGVWRGRGKRHEF